MARKKQQKKLQVEANGHRWYHIGDDAGRYSRGVGPVGCHCLICGISYDKNIEQAVCPNSLEASPSDVGAKKVEERQKTAGETSPVSTRLQKLAGHMMANGDFFVSKLAGEFLESQRRLGVALLCLKDVAENWDCEFVEGDSTRGHHPCRHCAALAALKEIDTLYVGPEWAKRI